MSVDKKILLYNLAKILGSMYSVKLEDSAKEYIKENKDCDNEEKTRYIEYSVQLAKKLIEYVGEITSLDINPEVEGIICDFKLCVGKKKFYVSMDHFTINIKNIIPEKLMKICNYSKKNKIYKEYMDEYNQFCENLYGKIKKNEKYSDLSDEEKNKLIIKPMNKIVVNTISRKKTCASSLFNHLFDESKRLVLKLYKSRFVIYDFGVELDEVKSYRMSCNENTINIIFNNKASFDLVLNTNSPKINEHISLKYTTNFLNIDDLFAVKSGHI
jgi:hypothetical protein